MAFRIIHSALLGSTLAILATSIPSVIPVAVAASASRQTSATPKAQADSLLERGIQQHDYGDFQDSQQTLQQALKLYQQIKDRHREAETLRHLGRSYSRLGHFQVAFKYFQQSLAIAQELGDRQTEGRVLEGLGSNYLSQGEYAQALELLQQSLAIAQAVKDRRGESNTLAILGLLYHTQQNYQVAVDFQKKALKIRQEIKYRRGESYSLYELGNLSWSLNQYEQAIAYYQRSLPLAKSLQDSDLERTVTDSITRCEIDQLAEKGSQQLENPQPDVATQTLQQALALSRRIGDRYREARSLHDLGYAYFQMDNYTQALILYEQSLSIFQAIGDRHGEAWGLINLGKTYELLGDYPQALAAYQRSLELWQAQGDRQHEGSSLVQLGYIYFATNDLQQAEASTQQGLAIAREVGDRKTEGAALTTLTTIYQASGRLQQAIEYGETSLAIARELKAWHSEARALSEVGIVYNKLGDYSKAVDYLQQSLAIARKMNHRKTEGHALNNLGIAFFKAKNFVEAEKTQREAIQVWESLRPALSDPNQVSIFDTQTHTYANLQSTLVAAQKFDAALEVAEQGRARALIALLTSRGAGTASRATPPTLAQIRRIAKTQNATLVEYSNLSDNELLIWVVKPSGAIAMRRVDLTPLKQRQNTSLTQLTTQSSTNVRSVGQLVALGWQQPTILTLLLTSLGSMIGVGIWSGKHLLTQATANQHPARNYWLVTSSLLIAALGSSGLVFWQTQMPSEVSPKPQTSTPGLAQLVSETRASVRIPATRLDFNAANAEKLAHPAPQTQLQQLYQLLIQPIADLLPQDPNAHVIFIPQQSLFLVPFPALQDPSGQYLIEKHTILTAPAIQALELTNQQKQRLRRLRQQPLLSQNALIVGNPTMPKVAMKAEAPAYALSPLPGTEQEATAIAALAGTQAIIGNQATKAAVLQKMPQASLIHLATHGLLGYANDSGIPGAIALAPDSNDDGLLTAQEILNLKLNAELVILSACDTGVGRLTGDGVIGLSRSFMAAGVPSAIVSLWAVPDDSTAMLMTQFYQNLRQNPDKAQALRQAMLATQKEYPEPFQWAAFTLIGEAL